MADMPNDFWSGWIILITLISFIALAWLVISVYTAAPPDPNEVEETIWDGNLEEGQNPAPLWWFWLIFAMMVFSVFYLMFYPGLGSFKGAFQWSQGGELSERYNAFNENFTELRAEIVAMPLDAIQANDALMGSASDLYKQNCAACHGYEAQGQANLFPNLTDGIWQWGGSPENIEQTLLNGRVAVMASWDALLGQQGVTDVANYVLVVGTPEAEGHPGQARFNQICAACHGIEGTGNPLLGAPSLVDDVWLYGGDVETIRTTLREGRNGRMPAFGDKLDDAQIRLLVAWLTK
ncbi:MAG: cytochrome-c oxidase, cbb3-type subunit III [Gammaproteobacteria bacterium]|nr:cytochrome-c oxidase, cbb3-type subunit III [Gammaproteobacteria bacterium]